MGNVFGAFIYGRCRRDSVHCVDAGVPLVIAGSFSATYERNAFNNGFILVECPGVVNYMRDTLKAASGKVRKAFARG